jgi:large subunit ribosomal protein L21e
MPKRIGGFRRKTRHKLQKTRREKGKISIAKYFQKFEEGDKVLLKAEPAIHNGMYLPKYHGKVCVVKGMQGKCYKVKVMDGNKEKELIVHPIHLRRVQK